MSQTLTWIKYVGIFIFGFILSWNLKCAPKCPETFLTKGGKDSISVVEKHDTAWIHITDTRIKTRVDTIQVAQKLTHKDSTIAETNYFKKFIYNKSLSDTNINLDLVDTVSQNTILGEDIKYQILRPTSILTTNNITNPVKNKLLLGLQVGGSINAFGLMPTIIYFTKTDKGYSGGYDILNKQVFIGAYFKL